MAQDVWGSLETNWNNFFWLTGETPITLSILVNQLYGHFIHVFHYGHRSKLDFRNQVTFYIVQCQTYYIY